MESSMAPNTKDPDLVIMTYSPAQSSRTNQLQRRAALSHAAKVSHARRQPAVRYEESSNVATGRALSVRTRRGWEPPSVAKRTVERQFHCQLPHGISHGENDPFDSTALRITPEVSMLLSLWKEHTESNVVSATRRLSRTALRQDLVLFLENELHAKSLLFICSALLSSRFSDRLDLRVKTLERKRDCLKQLKERIISEPADSEPLFVRGLSMVFIAAVLSNEPIEARLHAKYLCKALMPVNGIRSWNEQEQIGILCRIYYYDEQCALMYMRPPVLDPKLPIRQWKNYLAPIRQWVQNQTLVPGAIRYPAFSQDLEALFIRLQEYINIQCVGVPELSRSIEGFALTSPVIYSIELTSLFFGHLGFAESQCRDEIDNIAKYGWQIENILTLTALAFLACAVSGAQSISGLSKRGAKAVQNLRGLLQRTSCPVDGFQDLIRQYSQLWALYVGAMWEWDSATYDSGDKWFSMSLRRKIWELGVNSWSDFREIMHNFLYIPSQPCSGSTWFSGMDRTPPEPEPGGRQRTSAEFLRELLFAN